MENKKIIGVFLIFLLLGFACILTLERNSFDKYLQRLEDEGLSVVNKKRTIEVGENIIVTYKDYEEPVNEESEFYITNEKRRKKLSAYMKENNYKLKSGTYVIGDSQSFEEVIKILKFEKIK
jgi:lipoprotein